MTRRAREEMHIIEGKGNITVTRQLDGFASVLRLQFRQFGSMSFKGLGEFFQHGRARSVRQLRPAAIIIGFACRGDSALYNFYRYHRYLGIRFTRSRADILGSFTRTTIDELTV